jgi:hypothetical protein
VTVEVALLSMVMVDTEKAVELSVIVIMTFSGVLRVENAST